MLGRRFDGGADLSGGEWQKIALARAYMRDASLIVLDEPTAALDARAEYEVFRRFNELTRGKMAVLISHRFSTVRMADRILVLEDGRVIESGSHEQLLDFEGQYAELFNLQAAGYREGTPPPYRQRRSRVRGASLPVGSRGRLPAGPGSGGRRPYDP